MEAPYHQPHPGVPAPHYSMQQAPSSHDQNYRPLLQYGALPQNVQYQYVPSPHFKAEPPSSDNGAPSGPGSVGPEPQPYSAEVIQQGRRYALEVKQQPQRARMCGFGDKDRRPITPPPCIRLVITSLDDGKEVDINDIDHAFFVLNVDMWSADGQREVNLVRHTSQQPGPYSQGGSMEPNTPGYAGSPSAASGSARDAYQYGYTAGGMNGASQPQTPSYSAYPPPQQSGYITQAAAPYGQSAAYPPPRPASPDYNGRGYQDAREPYVYQRPIEPYQDPSRMAIAPAQQAPAGMFTRNLIGSLSASAFRLTDPQDKIGIWFILQDLSVRTEGSFRLRFSFVNVGVPAPGGLPNSNVGINTGKAPILASCFSDVFTVYSAKKFPGVVESTALSKCFATQGIKIPIRKDGAPGRGGKDSYEEDD